MKNHLGKMKNLIGGGGWHPPLPLPYTNFDNSDNEDIL